MEKAGVIDGIDFDEVIDKVKGNFTIWHCWWNIGFDAGYNWCKSLSTKPKGYTCEFWPIFEDSYRDGFAEGVITGKLHFKVNFKWSVIGVNLIEKV